MAINSDVATAIINEYRSGFEDDQPIPEKEDELIARATFLYQQAKQSYFEEGVRDSTVASIIFIGDSATIGDKMEETYPRRSSGGLSESDERETEGFTPDWDESKHGTPGFALMQEENLPIPYAIEGDADPMPRDLTVVSDKAVRKLSGEYNAFLSRTTYLLSIESADLNKAEHLLNAAKGAAMKALPAPDKKRTLKEIDALISDDPGVAEWSEAVLGHEQKVAVLKGLKEIYAGNISVLSREWTMRQNEWEKGR